MKVMSRRSVVVVMLLMLVVMIMMVVVYSITKLFAWWLWSWSQ